MTIHPYVQSDNVVILSLSDKDRRRTSTSTVHIKFNRSKRSCRETRLLVAAICYPFSSYRLLITDY